MMPAPRLLIIGAGGFGRTVADVVLAQGQFRPVGFLDDTVAPGRTIFDIPVLGATAQLKAFAGQADVGVVAIGDNSVRERLCARLEAAGLGLASIVHERAVVAERAELGAGVAIMGGAVVGTEARLGRGVIVNAGATVDHHAVVADFGHIGAGASLAGGAQVGARAWLRAGCILGYGATTAADEILPPGTTRGN